MKLFVANFDEELTEEDLKDLFEKYAHVKEVTIWVDFETARSKGFGFVKVADDCEGMRAISKLDGKWWHSRRLKVSEARK